MAKRRRPRTQHEPNGYCRHKTHGFGFTRIDGKHHRWPGKHDSDESRAAYEEYRRRWFSNRRAANEAAAGRKSTAGVVTMGEVIAAYAKFLMAEVEAKPGREHEVEEIRRGLTQVGAMFAELPPNDFGADQIREIQEHYRNREYRGKYLQAATVNKYTARIKAMIRWAEARKLMPEGSYGKLLCIEKVKPYKARALPCEPRRPVPDDVIEATLPHLSSVVGAMVRLQRATGMRPSEVCDIRRCDIRDVTFDGKTAWMYEPPMHKNRSKGKDRKIILNADARAILEPFIRGLNPDSDKYLFSPKDADAEVLAARNAKRVTPLRYGNRPGTNKKRRPKQRPSDRYEHRAYRRAVRRGCERAFPAPRRLRSETKIAEWHGAHAWTPYQLRHSYAESLFAETGDTRLVQHALGHDNLETTAIYLDKLREGSFAKLAAM